MENKERELEELCASLVAGVGMLVVILIISVVTIVILAF